jgi:hypothetical protein
MSPMPTGAPSQGSRIRQWVVLTDSTTTNCSTSANSVARDIDHGSVRSSRRIEFDHAVFSSCEDRPPRMLTACRVCREIAGGANQVVGE